MKQKNGKGDLVMSREQRRQYALERKLSCQLKEKVTQLEGLKRIIVHNGYRAAEVEGMLKSAGVKPDMRYFPLKSTEPHFYVNSTGDLHAVNSRGVTRLVRDTDLHETLCDVLRRDIKLEIDHYQNDPAEASKRFEDFAHELNLEVLSHVDADAVAENGRICIMMGPHESLGVHYEEEQFNAQNDFLNYKILEVGDQVVVAFDYIFADQARNVLSQMYSTLSARFGGIDVSVFHFGKVGLLAPSLDIGHICVVTGSIDEEDIQQGDLRLSPIHNQLDPQRDREIAKEFAELVEEPIHYGTTVNTISVLRQTKQALEQDLKAGGDFLDMEWSAMAGLDHGRRSCYPHLGQIRYFFAGIGSDNPMKGATLGNTAYPRETERKVAEAFLELIRRDYL